MMALISDLKSSTREILQLKTPSVYVAGYKIDSKTSVDFRW